MDLLKCSWSSLTKTGEKWLREWSIRWEFFWRCKDFMLFLLANFDLQATRLTQDLSDFFGQGVVENHFHLVQAQGTVNSRLFDGIQKFLTSLKLGNWVNRREIDPGRGFLQSGIILQRGVGLTSWNLPKTPKPARFLTLLSFKSSKTREMVAKVDASMTWKCCAFHSAYGSMLPKKAATCDLGWNNKAVITPLQVSHPTCRRRKSWNSNLKKRVRHLGFWIDDHLSCFLLIMARFAWQTNFVEKLEDSSPRLVVASPQKPVWL